MRKPVLMAVLLTTALTSMVRADSTFDGGRGTPANLPSLRFTRSAPRGGLTPVDYTQGQPQIRSTADLFYFSPEEVMIGIQQFGPDGENAPALGYTFDSNVPPAIQQQMIADLAFIGSVQGSQATPLHQQIFGSGPISGTAYSRFFTERVRGIGMSDCGSPIAVACVMPFFHPNKMWLTPNFTNFSHPQIARLMIVYHEARHTESRNGNWSHAYCPRDFPHRSLWTGAPLANEPACDVTPFGSYGSSTIMLKNIAMHCPEPFCSSKVREDADLYATDQLLRVIDPRARRDMEIDFNPAVAGFW